MATIIYSSRIRKPLKPVGLRTKRQRMKAAQEIALEKQADAILKAITGNQCLPTRQELKRMVNSGKWEEIGRLFNFQPVFMKTAGGKDWIDWRCVPVRVYELLQINDHERNFNGDSAPVKKKRFPLKVKERVESVPFIGRRQHFYCEQSACCHYCGQYVVFAAFTVDHKTPLCRGGKNAIGNLVGSCKTCNHAKGCLDYDEFMATDYMGGSNNLKQEIKRVTNIIRGITTPTPL